MRSELGQQVLGSIRVQREHPGIDRSAARLKVIALIPAWTGSQSKFWSRKTTLRHQSKCCRTSRPACAEALWAGTSQWTSNEHPTTQSAELAGKQPTSFARTQNFHRQRIFDAGAGVLIATAMPAIGSSPSYCRRSKLGSTRQRCSRPAAASNSSNSDSKGRAAIYLPEEARFEHIASLPTGANVGEVIDAAMEQD